MSSCDSKTGYSTQKAAQDHAKKRIRENRTLDLRVYHCSACGKWHMTHVPDRYPKRKDEDAA